MLLALALALEYTRLSHVSSPGSRLSLALALALEYLSPSLSNIPGSTMHNQSLTRDIPG